MLITVDFETFYSKDFTLSKMSTSEYIRDPRFSVHGVGIKMGTKKAIWYPYEKVPGIMKKIDWSKHEVLCHHAQFDGFIMTEIFKAKPKRFYCTLSMSRAAHGARIRHNLTALGKEHGLELPKKLALEDVKGCEVLTKEQSKALGVMCCNDVDMTYEVFFKLLPHIPEEELELIDLTIKLFTDATLKIDIPRAEAELKKELAGKAAALLKASVTPEDLMSNVKFAALLEQHGVRVPLKISPSTGELAPAFAKTDDGMQELLNHKKPIIRDLAAARLKVKSTIGETRATRMIEAGKDGMYLPVYLNYCGAHTTRWSGGNKINLQNLPRGGELRKSILAPKGHVVVVADSAQIEARVLAWLADQADLIEAFRQKRDVYSEFASIAYGFKVDKNIHKGERFVGKTCVLGLGYGMGAKKLRNTLHVGNGGMKMDLEYDMCVKLVEIYRQRNFKIKALWDYMDRIVIPALCSRSPHVGTYKCLDFGHGYVRLPSGLFLQYADVEQHENRKWTFKTAFTSHNTIYGGLLTENVVQALARCIIAYQMLLVNEKYRVVTTTHDEIVAIAPKAQGQKCLDFMLETMHTPPDWCRDIPLAAEGGFDVCYSK